MIVTRFALVTLLSGVATAAEFDAIDVRQEEATYYISASARVDASLDAVRAVITDYRHLHWITGAVLESSRLDDIEPGIVTIRVRSRACFGIFCKTFEQVQTVDESERGRVIFNALPYYSDVKRARSEWRLLELDSHRTQVSWDMHIEPDFWVPPLIGSRMIRRGLFREGRDMINGIEKLAREREARQ